MNKNILIHARAIQRFVVITAILIYISYQVLPITSFPLHLLTATAIGVISSFFILKLYNAMTADMTADLVFKTGGKAKMGYSKELALAKQDRREEACQSLLESFAHTRDEEALRIMLRIAHEKPTLDDWAVMACQGLLKDPNLHEDARFTYTQILSTLKTDPMRDYERELFGNGVRK